ncbi:MAG TPA: class I SAM-dependent methyltransferase [Cyanobacteria bacterium UBA8156]|nr:class I SAM-dependent methyltransferase [Cyanobacteria bacterium UBA8156]
MDVFAASPLSANPVERAVLYKAKSQTGARGEMTFPCLPSLKGVFFQQLQELLGALAQNFTAAEWQKLETLLYQKIEQGFAASPHARVLFRFEPPDLTQGLTNGFRLALDLQVPSTADKYQRWTKTRPGALFGTYPDAKALAVLAEVTGDRPPSEISILDIGAGPGRNTLPLAAKGYAVTAIELAPVFVEQLQQNVDQANLQVEVVLGNVLSPETEVWPAHYGFVLVSEVVPHFRSYDEVRQLLCRVCDALLPGGELLVGGFAAETGYEPSALVREMAQVAWSFFLTAAEWEQIWADLPLILVEQVPVLPYEQAHVPSEHWPPTTWFESWASGRDIFPTLATPPVALQWFRWRRL